MAEISSSNSYLEKEGDSSLDVLPGPRTRPYRSHRFPACDFCRRRKSRCTRDALDRPCVLCRTHGISCSSLTDGAQRGSPAHPTRKRNRFEQPIPVPENVRAIHNQRPSSGITPGNGTQEQLKNTGHIIGPAVARDAQVLERYMLPVYNTRVSHAQPNPYSVYSDDPRNPVVYLKVPRQRGVFPSGNGTSSFRQFETMEKILEPLGAELFQV